MRACICPALLLRCGRTRRSAHLAHELAGELRRWRASQVARNEPPGLLLGGAVLAALVRLLAGPHRDDGVFAALIAADQLPREQLVVREPFPLAAEPPLGDLLELGGCFCPDGGPIDRNVGHGYVLVSLRHLAVRPDRQCLPRVL